MPVRTEFLQNVQVVVVEKESIQLDYIGMLHVRMYLQLSNNLICNFLVFYVLLRDNLQSTRKTCVFMSDDENLAEVAFSKSFSFYEIL